MSPQYQMEPRPGGKGPVCTSAIIFHKGFYFYLSETPFLQNSVDTDQIAARGAA